MVTVRVRSAPSKPLLIYDGDCNFCKFWILRWQRATASRIDFLPSQDPDVKRRFPEIPPEAFDESVQFIETNGTVYHGAEAAFRSLTHTRFWAWTFLVYEHVPGARPITEWSYHFVSKHRPAFSFLTNVLSGRAGALPSYSLTRWIFLRALGVIYLSAFFSLGTQIGGLIGANGIAPANNFMSAVQLQCERSGIGIARYHLLPTLCWFSASDRFLHLLCGAGGVLALLLIFDIAPATCLFLLWLIYLSLSHVGNVFLQFQWDALLLETGFLAIFLAPLHIFPRLVTEPPPSRLMLWLSRWLLFRLMFESGLVKLLSHDANWHSLNALKYHYETQPLPIWIGWYAHQLPIGIQHACVFIMFIIELIVPFLIFTPRRPRFLACALLLFLQICILLTGNYCFFNLLTIALCLLLLDDAFFARFIPKKWRKRILPADARETFLIKAPEKEENADTPILKEIKVPPAPMLPPHGFKWPFWLIAPIALVYLIITVTQLLGMWGALDSWPAPLAWLHEEVAPFESANTYGLFAIMTTSRLEISIEGSNDGQTWLEYEFKYKPGDPKRRPGFVAPHQPRLDWQMWFAALGTYRQNPWLVNFSVRLLQASPEVLSLLAKNPFPNTPPKYIRARVYDYHFSNFEEHRKQGIWWRREYKGEYLPAFSLADLQTK